MEALFTVESLAERWNVATSFVRDRLRIQPIIKFIRLGSRRGIRFREADVLEFEASRLQGESQRDVYTRIRQQAIASVTE